jgi:enoyl-CoA hydratase/carnithine racemase
MASTSPIVNSQTIISQEQGVIKITLNRVHKMNALTQSMYEDLNHVFQLAKSDDIKVVMICAEGEHFTAGHDLAEFLAVEGPIEQTEVVKLLFNLVRCKKPVVAAVQGNTIGIGTTMLMHCDIVVAAEDSQFSLPFTPLGLCPEAGSSWLLPRLAGYQKAAELLLLGEPFDVHTAEHIGMINKITPVGDQQAVANEYCAKFLKLPTEALKTSKSLLKHANAELEKIIYKELKEFSRLLVSDEAKAIFKAFLEGKR